MIGLGSSVLWSLLVAVASLPTTKPHDPHALTASLGDADPAVRTRAAQQLRQLGRAARPALREASQGTDAEVRARAAELLGQLPWDRPEDPPAVRQILVNYARMSVSQRQQAVARLASVPEAAGHGALLRLLEDEPSDEVKWPIVTLLRNEPRPADAARLRQLDPPEPRATSAPLLAAMGWAWEDRDVAKAMQLLREAVEVDATRPALDAGGIGFVFDTLVDEAVRRRRYDEAAALRRRQCARPGVAEMDDAVPHPVATLFALHAEHGPLAGWEDDWRALARYAGRPQVLYAMARLRERAGDWLGATAMERTAFALGYDTPERHWAGAEFLVEREWDQAARRELEAVIEMGGPGSNHEAYAINARFRLAAVAVRRGDDGEAAEQLRQAMESTDRMGGMLRRARGRQELEGDPAAQSVWAEIHWRYFRAARTRGDAQAMREHVEELLKLPCDNPDIAIDVVPALRQMQRDDEARRFFDKTYAALKAQLDANPRSPSHMNNLAWLCARCGERLEEALALAQAAVREAPDNAAFLDTCAEAHFRLGHRQDAVRLETRALELRPGDQFMQEQLARFQTATRDRQ